MPDLIHVAYNQSGNSINTNELGMRDMQARAYDMRMSQYLLIKSPPASGKYENPSQGGCLYMKG